MQLLKNISNRYWYLYVLMCAFVILKLYRGVNGVESSGGGLWNVIQVFFIIAGFAFFFSKYVKRNSAINLLLLFSVWVLIVALPSMISSMKSDVIWFYYFSILCAPSVLMVFYCVGQKYDIHDFSLIIKTTYYALIILFYYYMTDYRSNIGEGFFAFADIYYPLTLLPLVLLLTPPRRSYIPFIFALVGVIVSGKRGGLVIVSVVAFWYFIFREKRNFGQSLLLISLLIVLIVISSSLIGSLDALYGTRTLQRMEEISEDGGSGRMDKWNTVLYVMSRTGAVGLMFGHGFNSSFYLLSGRVHNDFLEVLYNFGLVAVLLYLFFYINLIKQNIKQYRVHYQYSKYLTCSISISLILSTVSYFIVEPTYIMSSMFVTGLLLGDSSKVMNNHYYG